MRRVGAPSVPGDRPVASGDDRTAPGKEEAFLLWMQTSRVLCVPGVQVPFSCFLTVVILPLISTAIRGSANAVQSRAGGLGTFPLCESWL